MTARPRALVLHAMGTNRGEDLAFALERAGAAPEVVPVVELRRGGRAFKDFQLLVLPGGFSYADALGAGRLLALDLKACFDAEVRAFVESGKPVLGICNGFQALVKAGILPDLPGAQATLTFNASGRFECRWGWVKPVSRRCVWTRTLDDGICCPVAHGEGRLVWSRPGAARELLDKDQVALRYGRADGGLAGGAYPDNPNGSELDIAGVCNARGNVLGLMPHPENHVLPEQHPRWTRGEHGGLGLTLLEAGVRHAAAM